MRKLVATMTMFGCIWVLPCNAQQPDPKNEKDRAAVRAAIQRAAERRAKEEPCPFTSPRLSSADPAEVAWAAARLTAEDCQKPEVAAAQGITAWRLSISHTDTHAVASAIAIGTSPEETL